jgi:hypothetical protein
MHQAASNASNETNGEQMFEGVQQQQQQQLSRKRATTSSNVSNTESYQ